MASTDAKQKAFNFIVFWSDPGTPSASNQVQNVVDQSQTVKDYAAAGLDLGPQAELNLHLVVKPAIWLNQKATGSSQSQLLFVLIVSSASLEWLLKRVAVFSVCIQVMSDSRYQKSRVCQVVCVSVLGAMFFNRMRYYEKKHFI